MTNLVLSFRALSVLHTSRFLFNKYGFHNVGVDRIIKSAKIPKATFYNYFHSKERLIEMSLTFQTDGLKHEVISVIYVDKGLSMTEKLRKIYFLHANVEGLYNLPFKAIFEISNANFKNVPKPHEIALYSRDVEESHKIYFMGWLDNTIRGDSVTEKNLEKTERLLGYKTYLTCKSKNLSSRWTDQEHLAKEFINP